MFLFSESNNNTSLCLNKFAILDVAHLGPSIYICPFLSLCNLYLSKKKKNFVICILKTVHNTFSKEREREREKKKNVDDIVTTHKLCVK